MYNPSTSLLLKSRDVKGLKSTITEWMYYPRSNDSITDPSICVAMDVGSNNSVSLNVSHPLM